MSHPVENRQAGLRRTTPGWAGCGAIAFNESARKLRFSWHPMTSNFVASIGWFIDGGRGAGLVGKRFRRSATFVKTSRETASSDTVRLAAICYAAFAAGLGFSLN
jgi:hypothetical protein